MSKIKTFEEMAALMDEICKEDLLEDRREYSKNDLVTAYDLVWSDAQLLCQLIQIEVYRLNITARLEQYKEELRWIDRHLFENIDTQTTRNFVVQDNICTKRLLRICDLIDKERGES